MYGLVGFWILTGIGYCQDSAFRVSVVSHNLYESIPDGCDRILSFRSQWTGKEYSSRFVGCAAEGIPTGEYSIRFRTRALRGEWESLHSCEVRSPNTVCVADFRTPVEPDRGGWVFLLEIPDCKALGDCVIQKIEPFARDNSYFSLDEAGKASLFSFYRRIVVTVLRGRQMMGSAMLVGERKDARWTCTLKGETSNPLECKQVGAKERE